MPSRREICLDDERVQEVMGVAPLQLQRKNWIVLCKHSTCSTGRLGGERDVLASVLASLLLFLGNKQHTALCHVSVSILPITSMFTSLIRTNCSETHFVCFCSARRVFCQSAQSVSLSVRSVSLLLHTNDPSLVCQ